MRCHYILNRVQKEEQLGSVVIKSLCDVNLDIEEGGFYTICGPEESGKSRLLNVLGLIDPHSAGEFYFQGTLISEYSDREISLIRATKLSYILQFLNLNLTSSVLENVSMVAQIRGYDNREAKEKAIDWLRRFDLSDKAMCIPLELDLLDIKKICLAKSMIKKPEILLLDDIYSKLTFPAAEELSGLLLRLNEEFGTTIVQTTRREDHIKPGTIIYDIQHGKTSKRCMAISAA